MPEEQPVTSTAFETFILLPFHYAQRDPARAPRILEDGLVRHLGARRGERPLSGVEVALPARMGARGDIHPDPVPGKKRDARRPEIYDVLVDLARLDGRRRHGSDLPGRRVTLPGAGAQNAVADAYGPPVGIDVHEPRHEVRVRRRRRREQRNVDGTEDGVRTP